MLELPENKEGAERNKESNEHKCPTCQKKYETKNRLNKHRANGKKCKDEYKARQKDKIELCEKCDKWIYGDDNWQKHKTYHCNNNNEDGEYREIDEKGFCDRRKTKNLGTPDDTMDMNQRKITYDKESNKWKCKKCGKEAEPYNLRGLIAHAENHNNGNAAKAEYHKPDAD